MDFTTLGASGLKVSRACLGTMNFAASGKGSWVLPHCDETEARRIIDAFVDDGNNFIDTADNYTSGESEEIIGRAVKGRRDSLVLATKGGGPTAGDPLTGGLSRRILTESLHASLRRLGTDHIDLYQCHLWDDDTPLDETMTTLDDFVRAGKVRYLGCSNFTAAQIVASQWAASRNGGTGFISLQAQYSLVQREIDAEVLPTAARHGLGTMAYSPLGGGVLSGRYRRGAEPEPDSRLGFMKQIPNPAAQRWAADLLSDEALSIAEEVIAVAAELDTTPAAVALAWTLRRPHITSLIIGPRSLEQYRRSAEGFGLGLPEAAVERLDRISEPGNLPVNGAPQVTAMRREHRGA